MLSLNRGWLFQPRVTPGDAGATFDDKGFASVVLPHTNKSLPWHGFDDSEYEFISTYRRHFRLPAGARGHRVFVDFEGAMTALPSIAFWLRNVCTASMEISDSCMSPNSGR
jgi:beta-galactosidase